MSIHVPYCVETFNLGVYQHKNSVKQVGISVPTSWELSLAQVGIHTVSPARIRGTHLMSTRPSMQEARERFKKIS